jgi:signal transduction histidine kinase
MVLDHLSNNQSKSQASGRRRQHLRRLFPFPLRFSIPAALLIFGTLLSLVNIQRETARSFQRVEEAITGNAKFAGDHISGILEYLYRRNDVEQSEIAISQMRSDPNLRSSLLFDENNEVLLATAYELRNQPIELTPAVHSLSSFSEVRATMSGQVLLSADKQHIWAIYPVLLATAPGELRPSRVGILWLEYDAATLKHQALIDAWQRSLETAAGLGLLCIAAWFFFEKILTQRAAHLVGASNALMQGDLSQRAKLEGSDELAQIASAFNQMADRIQTNTEALQANEAALKQANETLESRVKERTAELQQTLNQLWMTQAQLVQTEKMSSLGQLVAGVAHEINNPVSFIHGNIEHAMTYAQDLLELVELYRHHYTFPTPEIVAKIEEIDLEFLLSDFTKTLKSMQIGSDRIRQIVLSLRNFSRLDEATFKPVAIHDGINSTLLLLQHRLKATPTREAITVITEYGNLPLVECCAGQLNQVFMNILTNAIDALEGADELNDRGDAPHQITIRTSVVDSAWAQIAIANNGPGIPQSVQPRIFDPFFTTKPVGKGTGMGMSISYQIVTKNHSGRLKCFSSEEQGTEFVMEIPLRRCTTST